MKGFSLFSQLMQRFGFARRLLRWNGKEIASSSLLTPPSSALVSSPFHQQLGRRSNHLPAAQVQSMDSTGCLKEYDDVQYWDKRYLDEGEDTFDWYERYTELEPFLHRYVRKDARILMAGCGNAVLSEEMFLHGYNKEIVNIDFSSVVIRIMQNKYRHIPQLKYLTMDARNMAFFDDHSFDAVIDKGLTDSLLCGPNGFLDVAILLGEVYRVMKPGGVFMLVTYGEPLLRMHHLRNHAFDWKIVLHLIARTGARVTIPEPYSDAIPMEDNWECEYLTHISDPDINFVYVCTKVAS